MGDNSSTPNEATSKSVVAEKCWGMPSKEAGTGISSVKFVAAL
jgi:hypothetical protein